MNEDFQTILRAYDYTFPQELIAKEPASPRDSARLLVRNRKDESVRFDTFANIVDYLPKNAVLVFNKTKVVPAKLTLRKPTGGVITTLLLGTGPESLRVLASGTLKPGEKLISGGGQSFTVLHRSHQEAHLKPSFPIAQLRDHLERFGETPLPPYIQDSPLPEEIRRREYQTTFAEKEGSIAAPTAGLHFTKELIKKIEQSGRPTHYLTLHVHLGTFSPLTEEQWKSGHLHTEWYDIDAATAQSLTEAKREGRPIIPVGTTTVRALETAWDQGMLLKPSGATNLFIREGYAFRCVDGLITNFHVPKSSLLMLVSAFAGREKTLELYERAIAEKFRLFSFGDGMLIV